MPTQKLWKAWLRWPTSHLHQATVRRVSSRWRVSQRWNAGMALGCVINPTGDEQVAGVRETTGAEDDPEHIFGGVAYDETGDAGACHVQD